MAIYVETRIHGKMDELWRLTQMPELHVCWDLRFTDIEYLPRPDENQPQQFLYATRIGFGLAIQGKGETVGQRDGANGERTSALKFWSDDPKSLIREGAGYWRYVPTADGLRFFTSYDYRVRFGVLGRVFDALVFRPLIGWATAWSFDRLRLWIEKGIHPAVSLQRSLLHFVARSALAFVWLYQGAVPKLLHQHADELAMLQQAGFSVTAAPLAAQAIGWLEVVFGLAILFSFHRRWPFVVTIVLMIAATLGVALSAPRFLVAAFNPVSLNVLMAALAVVGLLASLDLPSARRCLRKPPQEQT
jgi:uncharacterized membrane protein YphA (DoxX/SURF4 family)